MLNKTDKKNSFWFTSAFAITSVLNFVVYTISYKSFSSDEFGIYILISSILMIGNTLDLGFGLATIREISQARERGDNEFIKKYYSTFFVTYLIMALIIASAFILYYLTFMKNSSLINSVSSVNPNYVFLILTVAFVFHFMAGYVRCFFEGFLEYIWLSWISITIVVINLAGVLVVYFLDLNIYYLCYVSLIVGIASFLLSFIYIISKYEMLRFDFKVLDFGIVKKLSKYGIKLQLSVFIGSFADPLMKYLIGSYLSVGHIAYFESAKKIINFTNGLIFTSQRSVFVKLSESLQSGKLTELVNYGLPPISRVANYYSVVVYGIANPIICFFILKWFGNVESVFIYLMFSMSYSFINFAGVLYNVLMVEGKGLILIVMQLINIISIYVFLMASLLLFDSVFGIMGYYLSTLMNIAAIFYLVSKHNGLDTKRYLDAIKIKDVILLNILLLIQIFLMHFFRDKFVFILPAFGIMFLLIYHKNLSELISKGKPMLLNILGINDKKNNAT